jgi:tetratricopeptide (TPR) repeat protein
MRSLQRGAGVTGVILLTLCPAAFGAAIAESRAPDLAAFLVKPARDALAARRFGLAISIYRGIIAIRGDADPAALELARAWTLAGEFDAAIEELTRHRRALADDAAIAAVERQIADLERRPRGFSGGVFEVPPAEAHAREAFRRGRRAMGARRFAEAAALFRAGVEMAPDLPGNHRELGEALSRLGRHDDARELFLRYLRLRPFGKTADEIRGRLAADGVLGRLSVASSFACEQVWMNRQPVPLSLPIEDFPVAPGRYRILCYSERYHFARYVGVEVPRGGSARAELSWAIIENRLDPWGRIVMENPDRETEMNDIGVWDEIGVPVPEDRRALKFLLRAADSSRRKEIRIKLEAGKRIPLVW